MTSKRSFSMVAGDETYGDKQLEAIRNTNDLVITQHLRSELDVDVLTANQFVKALRSIKFRFGDEDIREICRPLNIDFGPTTTARIEAALDLALQEVEDKSPTGLIIG